MMIYRARKEEELTSDELAVYEKFGFSEKFARLLFIRGIDTTQKVEEYFDFSLERLHDPFLLKGMRAAVERIETAIQNKERILIIGDYDADGICSVAILYKYLLTRHASTRYFLPDRSEDGYGLTVELIDKLHQRFEPKLIITVDCGISCPAEIKHAQSLGIDCIVTDHHTVPESIPDCICVNPKLPSDYPFHDLCGAGVALKLVHAIGGLEAAEKYIDICAIATVADIVALKDENRVITHLGLAKLNSNSLPSITALAKSCNIYGEIKSMDISYKIGPKINASGRMGNAKRGLDIILELDTLETEKIIQSLTNYNTQRQKLCNTIYEEVEAMVEREMLYKNNIIIAADERWESGVLGIVSARITERYGKPSIIFGKTENAYKGSGRSIEDVNIVKTIEQFGHLCVSFGGHSMAAGLTVGADSFDEFRKQITDYLNNSFSHVDLKVEKFYDYSIDVSEITPALVREFDKIEPTGCENNAPAFMTTITSAVVSAGNSAHLRFSYKGMQFMHFNGAECAEVLSYNFPKNIVFEFQKLDDKTAVKAITKSIIPIPTDAKSYAICLAGYLKDCFRIDGDIKFNNILDALNCDREVFVEYYKVIKAANKSRAAALYDLWTLCDKAHPGKLDMHQFIFVGAVFSQLGILNFQNGTAAVNGAISTDLFASRAYNKIRERGGVKIGIKKETKTLA